jgi:polysaccharide export outer membrane protein
MMPVKALFSFTAAKYCYSLAGLLLAMASLADGAIAQTITPTNSQTATDESLLESLNLPEAAQNPSSVRSFPSDPSSAQLQNSDNASISSYLLGPGDQIGIAVIDFAEFTQTRVILPDGTVLLPLIGPVRAAGQTLESLQADITRRLSVYLIDPVVELNLSVLRPVVVTVGGEVYRPGPVQLNSLTTVNTRVGNNAQLSSASTAPTLSTALGSAEGVRRNADLRNITVQRQLPGGRQTILTVNLWESIFQGTGEDDILLQDGDIVFVPTAPDGSEIDPQLVARSSLAPALVRVRVIGEVNRPGEVQISPESNVLTAIAVAGGHNDDANLSQVALIRLGDTGQVEGQAIDLSRFEDTTAIQDGDVIVVPERGYLNVVDSIARIFQPLTTPFNFFLLLDRVFNDED